MSKRPPIQPPPRAFPKKGQRGKRRGSITAAEQALVTQFVKDQPREVSSQQVTALARVLERTPATVKRMLQTARDTFVENTTKYVDVHLKATEKALEVGALETALGASQWAIIHASAEGQRIVDPPNKPSEGGGGTKIYLGVSLGGVDHKKIESQVIEIPATSAEPDPAE